MSDLTKYLFYFVLAGSIVSLATYLGSTGKGYLAALASTFPVITGMTFILIYLNGGPGHTVAYAKNLLWFVPPWVTYVSFVILGVNRLGFWPSILGGYVVYVGCVAFIRFAIK